MGGLTRFERRWAAWIRMRQEMRLQAYASDTARRMRRLAYLGLLFVLSMLGGMVATTVLAVAAMGSAHAAPVVADQIPLKAAQHKLALRREAHRIWGLDAPVATFAAQIHQESRWRPDAASPVGARGLAQFMPATARWISDMRPTGDTSLAGADMSNPTWALRALVTYDQWLWQRVTADTPCERMAYTLSAYNGGLGWVYKRQAIAKRQGTDPGLCFKATCAINPGIHPANQAENQHYPQVILLRFEPLYATAGWGKGACT
jgi:soluble lytic murein transglycosylase-like protein